MSRRELAEAVNAYVYATTGTVIGLDAWYVGKLERGQRRWPNEHYRAGLRAVLGAATDAELGFVLVRRCPADETFIASDPLLSLVMVNMTMDERE